MLVPCIGFRGVRYLYQVLSTFSAPAASSNNSSHLEFFHSRGGKGGSKPRRPRRPPAPAGPPFGDSTSQQRWAAAPTAAARRRVEVAAARATCACVHIFYFLFFFSWLVARRGRSGSAGQRERLLGAPACGHGAKQQQEQHLGGSQHLVSAAKATRPCNLLLPPPRTSLWVYNNCPRLTPCG